MRKEQYVHITQGYSNHGSKLIFQPSFTQEPGVNPLANQNQ